MAIRGAGRLPPAQTGLGAFSAQAGSVSTRT